MDNNQPPLSKEQEQSKKEMLERAGAFEQMVKTKGWEWVKSWQKLQLQTFINELITGSDLIESFEQRRQRIIGVNNLMLEIQGDLNQLETFRKEKDGSGAK